MNRRNTFLLMTLLMIIGLTAGGTFAYWTWYSPENKSVVFNTVGNVSDYIVYDEGSSHFVGDFQPKDSYCESVNTTLSFYKKSESSDIGFVATIHMDINSIGLSISESDDVHWVVTRGDNTISCDSGLNGLEVVASGTFVGRTTGESIVLVRNIEVTLTEQKYTIWIWIDSNGADLSSLPGETIDTNVWTRIDMLDSEGGTNIDNGGDTYTISFDVNGGEISTLYTEPGEHIYTVPETGTYKLEVWGAQGGTGMVNGNNTSIGGYGGYSTGRILLQAGTNLYANVGGKGENAADRQAGGVGGYNGGGTGGTDSNYSSSGNNEPGAGGGGASHIATASGVLSSLSSNTTSILIVAGGGGGAAYDGVGGSGGGIQGVNGNVNTTIGGTQTSGYAFGLGAPGVSFAGGTGAGGGGYYGGVSGAADGDSGTGGSGYIGNSLLTNKVMYCYNCTISNEPNTLTNTTTKVSENPVSNYAKSGGGAIRITKVDDAKKVTIGSTYGELPTPTKEGYIFKGWNTQPDGNGDIVTADTQVTSDSNHTLYAIWSIIPFSPSNPEGYSDYLHMALTVPGGSSGGAGWVKVFYNIRYDASTNQSTIVFDNTSRTHRIAAASAQTKFTCSTDITLIADNGTQTGGTFITNMTKTGTLTGQGVWTYLKVLPTDSVVVLKHSNDANSDKTVTISATTKHTYDYVATGSDSETIIVATSQ